MKACCFTGYRPEKFPFALGERTREYVKFENKLFDAVFSLPAEGVTRFYCGMAMGFDLLAAETVLMLRESIRTCSVDLICVMPFEEQAKAFPADWRRRFETVLASADEIVTMGKSYYRGCYSKRNRYMVDHSDIVVTYFDGQKGGTMNTLAYADRIGKRIVNLSEAGVHEYFPDENEYFRIETEGSV